MPVHDDLGIRMKENYEKPAQTKLIRRTPVAIRIDGKAFHTFTRGFQKPFDSVLIAAMQETTKYLCEHIQGCVFGYTQSDEITLILVDYDKLETCAWFDYEVQKLCSISASMATMVFNKMFQNNVFDIDPLVTFYDGEDPSEFEYAKKYGFDAKTPEGVSNLEKYCKKYNEAIDKGAMFDARCFNIPKEEVTNLIYWRQLDATRNSVQMVGRANYSHKELYGLSCNEIQNKLLTEKNINWNDYSTVCKRGSACLKNEEGKWFIDTEIPILKGEDRNYIDKLIYIGE